MRTTTISKIRPRHHRHLPVADLALEHECPSLHSAQHGKIAGQMLRTLSPNCTIQAKELRPKSKINPRRLNLIPTRSQTNQLHPLSHKPRTSPLQTFPRPKIRRGIPAQQQRTLRHNLIQPPTTQIQDSSQRKLNAHSPIAAAPYRSLFRKLDLRVAPLKHFRAPSRGISPSGDVVPT